MNPALPHWHDIPLLDEASCQAWSQAVLALRPWWTRRHPELPFFTLGLAAYLDAVTPDPELGGVCPYHHPALRRHHNTLLQRHFGTLLEHCAQALGRWLDRPARCVPEQAALPGFHIHLPHPVWAGEVASIHRDLQFEKVFPAASVPACRVLTFTLPLSLPAGAGLHVWREGSDGPRDFFPYRAGQMAVHSGLQPHQAVLHPQGGETPRIMLQGHGLIDDDGLRLYW